MRKFKALIGGLAFAGSIATCQAALGASGHTVKQLAADCSSQNQSEELLCMLYFGGFVDGLEAASALYGATPPICYPESGLSIEDWILTFRLWASTNPAEGENAAPMGVLMAMVERFPCDKP
jgi:hypothetical protein